MTGATDRIRNDFAFKIVERDVSDHFVDEIVALVQSAYRGDASRQGWTTEADFIEGQRVDADMVREVLQDPDAIILTARRVAADAGIDEPVADAAAGDLTPEHGGSELVGCCELRHQRASDSVYLGMFAVSPALQAAGIGRAFLQESERIATARWNASRMEITVVDVRASLIEWYERRGYVRTGKTGDFPYGDERFGVPLVPDLKFVHLVKEI